jgi:dCMP deaminase
LFRDLGTQVTEFSAQNSRDGRRKSDVCAACREKRYGMEIYMSDKRKDYISWDEYFMGVAKMSALRSKDPNTQVGACIVSNDNKILSMGYNGLPRGCSDDEFPWAREGDPLDNKYMYTAHSELNAILNYRGGSLDNAKLYVTLFPCNECAKAIIQAGIKTLVYECDKYADTASVIASKRMLNAAGVRYYQYQHTDREIVIKL